MLALNGFKQVVAETGNVSIHVVANTLLGYVRTLTLGTVTRKLAKLHCAEYYSQS